MSSQRYGTEKSVLRERILQELIGVLDSCKCGYRCLELGFNFRVIKDSQRASCDIVNNVLFDIQKERLALIDENLRDIFIQNDGTFNRILGQIGYFDFFINFAFESILGCSHFVRLNLSYAVLSS